MNYKTIILPIVSAACLFYGTITGHEISKDIQDQIVQYGVSVILFGVNVWGIYKSHKKGEVK